MKASSSSARLLRSVFRSSVRLARSSDINSLTLRIDPVKTFGLSKEVVEDHLGSGKRMLESGADLVLLLKRVLTQLPATAENLDKALLAVKRLNMIRAELKNSMQQEERESGDGDDPALWQDGVEYVGGAQSSPQEPPPASARTLPLFILGRCFFPEGETWMHVFEERYLEMMRDCAKADDCFGYVFGDDKGLARVGVICKITARKPLDGGRLAIRIKGLGRFSIHTIADPSTTPYVLASVVDPGVTDLAPQDDAEPTVELEKQLWASIKYYFRLLQLYDPKIRVTRGLEASRPKADSCHQADRRERFSFAVANITYIQTSSPRKSQMLLQTRSASLRLQAQRTLLSTATSALAGRLVDMGLLTEAQREAIQQRSMADQDDDADVLP